MKQEELFKANRLFYSIETCDDWAKDCMQMPVDPKLINEFLMIVEKIRAELQKDFDNL